jgi:hypothetical protein
VATLLSVREITLRFGGIVALDGVLDVEGQISGRSAQRRRQDDGVHDHALYTR